MDALTVTIDGGGGAVRLGPPGGAPGLHASGLAGWYGTPDGKWPLTERQLGDGAFAIEPSQVVYSSRTVTVNGYALGRTRAEALSSLAPLGAMAHRLVSIAVDDGVAETYATGALTAGVGKGVRGGAVTFTLTIVCPDPRRYGTDTLSATLVPGGNADGGLDLTEERLAWPLAWGESASSHSVETLHNAGTAVAYPTISIRGDIRDVTIAEPATGRELSISGYIGWQPIVLDCLSRTASISGVDVTRRLGRRDFPSIAPGGDTTLALMCSGTNGSVSIEWHDTYI